MKEADAHPVLIIAIHGRPTRVAPGGLKDKGLRERVQKMAAGGGVGSPGQYLDDGGEAEEVAEADMPLPIQRPAISGREPLLGEPGGPVESERQIAGAPPPNPSEPTDEEIRANPEWGLKTSDQPPEVQPGGGVLRQAGQTPEAVQADRNRRAAEQLGQRTTQPPDAVGDFWKAANEAYLGLSYPNPSTKGLMESYETAERANVNRGEAEAYKSQEMARQTGELARNIGTMQQELVRQREQGLRDLKGFADDVAKSGVDPDRFWHSKDTGGRIMAGIGLALGGMGAGLTHGPNLAFQAIQSAIARDIDAQKADMGKKQSLYSMAMDRFKDEQIAGQWALSQAYQLGQLQLQKVAHETDAPVQRAMLAQGAAQLGVQKEQAAYNAASQAAARKYQMQLQQLQYLRGEGAHRAAVANHLAGYGRPGDNQFLDSKTDHPVNLPDGYQALAHDAGTADAYRKDMEYANDFERALNTLDTLHAQGPLAELTPSVRNQMDLARETMDQLASKVISSGNAPRYTEFVGKMNAERLQPKLMPLEGYTEVSRQLHELVQNRKRETMETNLKNGKEIAQRITWKPRPVEEKPAPNQPGKTKWSLF
jgi:hypothetical protein